MKARRGWHWVFPPAPKVGYGFVIPKYCAEVKKFPLREDHVINRVMSIFKTLLVSSPLARSTGKFFLHLDSENLVILLEIKLTEEWEPS